MKAVGDVGAGHTLGRYELLVPIAQGGMAVVWAARMKGTRGFQKIVAVKTMLPSLSEDSQFEEMFLAEAELASRIKHPHVCEILDLGEQEGTLYLVMEWVDGEPLSTLQKAARAKGGIPIAVATRIALHAALGLHAAHELKDEDGKPVDLVHRDVSPQNVLVTYDGHVKIVDFGVAKAASGAEGTRTRAGQIKGKVPFMSPEQALGKTVDRRTDIFALAIVLYQMVTGKHPFRSDNDMATLHRICEKEPVAPIKSLVPTCPDALSDAVAKALDKNYEQRWQTMVEFARALERALAELVAAGKDDDLAGFVKATVGERADKRKAAIKEAIRVADERFETRKKVEASGQFPALALAADRVSASDISGVSGVSRSSPTAVGGRPTMPSDTGPASTGSSPLLSAPGVVVAGPQAAAGSSKRWIVLGGAVAAIAIAAAAFVVGRGGARPGQAPAPAADAPATPARADDPPAAATAAPAQPAAPAPSSSVEAPTVSIDDLDPEPAKGKPAGGKHVPARGAKTAPSATPSATPAPGPAVPKIRDPGF